MMAAAWMALPASVAMTWPWALSSSWGVTVCTCRFWAGRAAGAGLAAAIPGGFTTHGRVPITWAKGGEPELGWEGGCVLQTPFPEVVGDTLAASISSFPRRNNPPGGGDGGDSRWCVCKGRSPLSGTWPWALVRIWPVMPCTLEMVFAITGAAAKEPRSWVWPPREAALICREPKAGGQRRGSPQATASPRAQPATPFPVAG